MNRARVARAVGHDVAPHLRREASIHRDMGAVNLYDPCKRCKQRVNYRFDAGWTAKLEATRGTRRRHGLPSS
jgi:hypothetical protein